eukprot:11204208-Lingulodinium_polyedra.AAC.1
MQDPARTTDWPANTPPFRQAADRTATTAMRPQCQRPKLPNCHQRAGPANRQTQNATASTQWQQRNANASQWAC